MVAEALDWSRDAKAIHVDYSGYGGYPTQTGYRMDQRPLSTASTSATGLGPSRPGSSLPWSRPHTAVASRPSTGAKMGRPRSLSAARSRKRSARPLTAQSAGTIVSAPYRKPLWQERPGRPADDDVEAKPRPRTAASTRQEHSTSGFTKHGAATQLPPRLRAKSAPGLRPAVVPPPPPEVAEHSRAHFEPHPQPTFAGDLHDPTNTKMLLPIPAGQHSETLSGMKKEIKTIEFNLDHIQDRQDSARGHITDFRDVHPFPEQCEELRRDLWPVIQQAKMDIKELFAELDRETKDLQEQVDYLKKGKDTIAFVVFRMRQKVKNLEEIIGHR
jgi:hypothetical protein